MGEELLQRDKVQNVLERARADGHNPTECDKKKKRKRRKHEHENWTIPYLRKYTGRLVSTNVLGDSLVTCR